MSSRKVCSWLWSTALVVVFMGAVLSFYVASAFFPRTRCENPRRSFRNGVARLRHRGRVVTYMCVPGFTLVGSPMATCFNRRWDRAIPICAAPGCRMPSPTDFRYGTVVDVDNNSMVLQFECRPGFLLSGPPTTYCDGRAWNSSLPSCTPGNLNPALSCDFEEPSLCSWSLDLQRPLHFHREYTQKDHTFGDVSAQIGHVMSVTRVETKAPEGPQVARLLSPVFRSIESPGCFSMWYRFPCQGCVLRILLWQTGEPQMLWTGTGPDGDDWVQVQIAVPTVFQDFQILVEGSAGDPAGSSSDPLNITVDDVKLDPGSRECLPMATTEVGTGASFTEHEATAEAEPVTEEATTGITEPSTTAVGETTTTASVSTVTDDYSVYPLSPTMNTEGGSVPPGALTTIVHTIPTELPSALETESTDIGTTTSALVSVVPVQNLHTVPSIATTAARTTVGTTTITKAPLIATTRYIDTTHQAATAASKGPLTTSTANPQTTTPNVVITAQRPTTPSGTTAQPQTTTSRKYTPSTATTASPATSTSHGRPIPVVAPASRKTTSATRQTAPTTTAVATTTTARYFLRPRSTTKKPPPTSITRTSERPGTVPPASTVRVSTTEMQTTRGMSSTAILVSKPPSSTVAGNVSTPRYQSASTEKVSKATAMLTTTKVSPAGTLSTSPSVHGPATTTDMPNDLNPLVHHTDKPSRSTLAPQNAKMSHDGGSGSLSIAAKVVGALLAIAIVAVLSVYAVRKVKSRNQSRLSEESELAPLSMHEEVDPTAV